MQWETVNNDVQRIPVPGGWIYRHRTTEPIPEIIAGHRGSGTSAVTIYATRFVDTILFVPDAGKQSPKSPKSPKSSGRK